MEGSTTNVFIQSHQMEGSTTNVLIADEDLLWSFWKLFTVFCFM